MNSLLFINRGINRKNKLVTKDISMILYKLQLEKLDTTTAINTTDAE